MSDALEELADDIGELFHIEDDIQYESSKWLENLETQKAVILSMLRDALKLKTEIPSRDRFLSWCHGFESKYGREPKDIEAYDWIDGWMK